jgi:ATP-dependent RNA helicase SUPV3L1/SUV3
MLEQGVVEGELLGKPFARLLVRGEEEGAVQAAVGRIRELIASLPEAAQEDALEFALERLEDPTASLRKLEKRVRQRVIAERLSERALAARAAAPGFGIDDVGGAVRFTLRETLSLSVAGEGVTVQVVAARMGGHLEHLFLTAATEAFVSAAVAELTAELARARGEAEQAAGELDALVREREARALYNVRELKRIVRRALRVVEGVGFDEVLEEIRHELRPLDAEAQEKERVRAMVAERGLVTYRDYFPLARKMQRELVLFAGPTNSGKTWHALNALAEAESGVYLAPLRLLALEGQEEIERRGRAASYITGEERDIREGARFVASTIEMLDPHRAVDAVVIDEVQLLTDPDRGWAWCQALVGAPAQRVYMTGSPDCIPLVQAMADYLGEPLTVHHLERHTPIEPIHQAVKLMDVEPGTAIIAFSRRDVLAIRSQIERRYKVAVIYGNLTPEVRREEARRFRSGEAQVLVATDAIAMGLNLPIKTVLMSTLTKWNGREEVQLSPAELLQIGGRAGRFGKFEQGYVGTLRRSDGRRVAEVFSPGFTAPPRPLRTSVRPGSHHIEAIAAGLGTDRLAKVLAAFQRGMSFDSPLLSPGVTDDMVRLADIVDRHRREIPMTTRLAMACAPVDARSDWHTFEFGSWVASYASGRDAHLAPLAERYAKERAANDEELHMAEKEAKRLTAYAWLAYRFPGEFPDLEECQRQRALLDRFIERTLAGRTPGRSCRKCGELLPRRHRHPICDACYFAA